MVPGSSLDGPRWPQDDSKMEDESKMQARCPNIAETFIFPWFLPHKSPNLPGNGTESEVLELRGLSMRCDRTVPLTRLLLLCCVNQAFDDLILRPYSPDLTFAQLSLAYVSLACLS